MKLTRDLRNALRTQITGNAGWPAWRAANLANADGTLRDAASMTRADILRAALDLGVDIVAIAAAFGIATTLQEVHASLLAAPAYSTAPTGIQALVSGLAPAAPVFSSVTDALANGAPGTAYSPSTTATEGTANMTTDAATAPAGTYEGKDAAAIIAEALAPADGMVGPKLFDQLRAAVAPLAAIAVAPPRVHVVEREVVKTVTVRAPGADTGDTPPARLCQIASRKAGREAFGLKGTINPTWRTVIDEPVTLWDGTETEGVPAIDPDHVWDLEALAYVSMASRFADDGHKLRTMSRVLMYGPAGTGKTSTAIQFAARTGRPFFRIAFDRTTEAAELVGQRMPKAGGGTVFHEGALTQAMQVPGAVVLLDEPSFLRPGAAAVLQTILDTGIVYLKEDGNRAVHMAPGVMILAADNTALNGDETGRYADTLVQNIALQDRFGFLVPLDYLPEGQEAMVLHKRTGIHMDAARIMVNFATTTRRGAAQGQVTAGCSLRRLVAWATAVKAGVPSANAFKSAIMNAADAADRETIRGLEKNTANHAEIDKLTRGTTGAADASAPVTGQVSSAQAAKAASVFGSAPVPAI